MVIGKKILCTIFVSEFTSLLLFEATLCELVLCLCVSPRPSFCTRTPCSQVPPGCDRRRAGQPDQQPWGGSGHCQARCEDQTADHGAEGGDQQTETRAERTGHGLHGQWGFLMVYTCDDANLIHSICNQLFYPFVSHKSLFLCSRWGGQWLRGWRSRWKVQWWLARLWALLSPL